MPFRIRAERHGVEALPFRGPPDVHQRVHVANGRRGGNQQRVGGREDGGVGADADGERQRGGQREERRTREQTDGMPDVADERLHEGTSLR
jgi:hypothetical protein